MKQKPPILSLLMTLPAQSIYKLLLGLRLKEVLEVVEQLASV
jgi:hypothetical protein